MSYIRGAYTVRYIHFKSVLMAKLLHDPRLPTKKATFAMGCFWSPEPLYGVAHGVIRTQVGYTGGTLKNPTYHNLGDHTESVEMDYDPVQTSYSNLLKLFWEHHDPTSKHTRQYMSAIFYHSPEDKQEAEDTMKEHQKKTVRPILTEILPAGHFYAAEDYHQKYRLQQHSWLMTQLNIEDQHLFTSHAVSRLNGYAAGQGSLAVFENEWPLLGVSEEVAEYLRKIVKKGPGISCS